MVTLMLIHMLMSLTAVHGGNVTHTGAPGGGSAAPGSRAQQQHAHDHINGSGLAADARSADADDDDGDKAGGSGGGGGGGGGGSTTAQMPWRAESGQAVALARLAHGQLNAPAAALPPRVIVTGTVIAANAAGAGAGGAANQVCRKRKRKNGSALGIMAEGGKSEWGDPHAGTCTCVPRRPASRQQTPPPPRAQERATTRVVCRAAHARSHTHTHTHTNKRPVA